MSEPLNFWNNPDAQKRYYEMTPEERAKMIKESGAIIDYSSGSEDTGERVGMVKTMPITNSIQKRILTKSNLKKK